MRERLVDGLLRGDRASWGALGALWALTAILVLLHRPRHDGEPTVRRGAIALTFALLIVTTATSLAGLPLATALSVPRVRWNAVEAPELIAANAGDGFRKLRGPVVVIPGPEPDLAVPTLDASDHWVLFGMLSGQPIPGLPPAEAAAAAPGAPRLCRAEGTECRAWPVAWPDPARPPALGELMWRRTAPGPQRHALAYDVETGLYLDRIDPAPGVPAGLAGPHLEIIGRPGADAKLDGPSVVLVVRRVAHGHLRAARVAATPDPARTGGYAFQLHRADVSLIAAPRAFAWVAQPLLLLTSMALPLGLLVLVIARRRRATGRVLPWLEAAAAFAAGLAAAAPAVVAMASLWASR
ncbi:Hypothetical protein A7982_03368 [Minicystis rosea]|nr:Hypothetical protein A7982_03368 [Minicystis rosea]